MTENDEIRHKCHRINCYGVVKEYSSDGVREPSENIRANEYSFTLALKDIYRSLLGKEPVTITWYECSVCHEYHPELSD